jgi:hypothetical protein
MPVYPPEVLTTTKKGRVEARALVERGRYVLYDYRDPETSERTENKEKLVLVPEGKSLDEAREFFVIHPPRGRDLLVPAERKGERQVWDGEKAVDI